MVGVFCLWLVFIACLPAIMLVFVGLLALVWVCLDTGVTIGLVDFDRFGGLMHYMYEFPLCLRLLAVVSGVVSLVAWLWCFVLVCTLWVSRSYGLYGSGALVGGADAVWVLFLRFVL